MCDRLLLVSLKPRMLLVTSHFCT